MPPQQPTCLTLTPTATPDPHVTYFNDTFYLTFTGGNRIPLWTAPTLLDFYSNPTKGPIYTPPSETNALWAPELHALHGRWYIFYAAQNAQLGNKSHRMYILGGPPSTSDPRGEPRQWKFLGPIKGTDQRQWAIDGTVFTLPDDGRLYFVYSGWPLPPERNYDDVREDIQQLFIIRLKDPITADSPPVCICRPDQPWEKTGKVEICEGPEYLSSPSGHWRGLVYSCGASWTKEYKMATLRYVGGDPLSPDSWQKGKKPLLQNADHGEGPFGPGHGCFLHFEGETVAIFHATDRETDGNQGRKARMQRVEWTEDGPFMGEVVGRASRELLVPGKT